MAWLPESRCDVLIDTHCHLDEPPLAEELDAVLARARGAGVERVIVPGVRPAQWTALGAMAEAHAEVAIGVGLHPHCLPEHDDAGVDDACRDLRAGAVSLGAIAIGECGFDGAVERAGVALERQAVIVRAHAEIADELELPLIVHVVGAMGFALSF